MENEFKQLVAERIKNNKPVIIELGCGPSKHPDAIGIDLLSMKGVDIVADLNNGLPFIENDSVDEIITNHTLEHIANFELVITEIHRILKKEGVAKIRVPHFANPHYYSDYTHVRFFGLYSFDYFCEPEYQLRRKVPAFYDSSARFKVVKRKLHFKSTFFLRGFIKRRIWQPIFNINGWFQELYEECFCYMIPCSELYFEIKK